MIGQFDNIFFFFRGEHQFVFQNPITEAQKWDLYERGPRLFIFQYGYPTLITHLSETLALFEPCLTEGVSNYFAGLNLKFLEDNAGIIMEPRPKDVPEILPIDKNLVKNGDTFNIMRLDGLDPMIAWAMGSATGHTAIAMWKEDEVINHLIRVLSISNKWLIHFIDFEIESLSVKLLPSSHEMVIGLLFS